MALIKSKKKLCFNSEQWLQMQGLVHTYIHDRNHVICGMNQLQLDVMKDLGYCEKDIIGNSIDSIFYNDQDKGNIVILENETVLAENIPKQYYNTLIVKEFYRIELLTTKIPIYDTEGKIFGIAGISQYINKFHLSKVRSLGLSPREIDCLLLILENKSAKQIAQVLSLSVRTVEHYIDNIKHKLKCSSKMEILLKFSGKEFNEKPLGNQSLKNNSIITYPLE